LEAQHQPATPTEELLVRQLAMAAWRQLRLFRMEVAHFKNEDEDLNSRRGEKYASLNGDRRMALIADLDAIHEKQLLNFHRFEVRLERTIRTTIQELRRCRAERPEVQTEDAQQPEIRFGSHPAARSPKACP